MKQPVFESQNLRPLFLVEQSAYTTVFNRTSKDPLPPVGIDLTVGGRAFHISLGRTFEVADNSPLELYPGDAVVLETAETLSLPLNCWGLVSAKLSLVRQGIVQAPPSVIDFGYGSDRPRSLELIVTNESTQKRLLRLGDPICRVTLLATEQVVAHPYREGTPRRFEPYLPVRFSGTPTSRQVRETEGYVDRTTHSLYQALEETSSRLDARIREVAEDRAAKRALNVGMLALLVAALGILITALLGVLDVVFTL